MTTIKISHKIYLYGSTKNYKLEKKENKKKEEGRKN